MISLFLSLLGAWLSRWHGGGWNLPAAKVIKNLAWAIPFGLVVWLCGGALWLCILAVALCAIGKATGHGRGLGLDEPMRDDMEPEKVEYLIRWLEPSLTNHAYKHVIMALTGVAGVSGGVVAFCAVSLPAALILALSGILKGVAYEIGLGLDKKLGFYKTEWGELITGFFAYGGLAIGLIIAG